jgi:cell division septum initiation protein DivIVA
MLFGWKKRCRQLEAENAQLKAHAAQLEARLAEAQAKNQQLVQALAAARKTSRNSSKRPSSDIVKPPPKPLGKGKKRKIGAQPGHPKHEHPAFTPAQIDHHIAYELERCPVDPAHRLVPLADQQ